MCVLCCLCVSVCVCLCVSVCVLCVCVCCVYVVCMLCFTKGAVGPAHPVFFMYCYTPVAGGDIVLNGSQIGSIPYNGVQN